MTPRFSANLSFLFGELPMLERFAAAAASGFGAVEYMFPYDYDISDLKQRLREHRLEQVLFNLPAGDFAAGERGIAADPSRTAEFERGVASAVQLAGELHCPRVNCLVGKARADVDAALARRTLVANLRRAASAFAAANLTLLIEPLNRLETPGFLVGTIAEALALIDEIDAPNVRVQFDCYHAQRAEGNVIDTFRRNVARVGHVQIADSPARNEPGTGELAYPFILREIAATGYDGWIGLEYKPSRTTVESFEWIERFGFARNPGAHA